VESQLESWRGMGEDYLFFEEGTRLCQGAKKKRPNVKTGKGCMCYQTLSTRGDAPPSNAGEIRRRKAKENLLTKRGEGKEWGFPHCVKELRIRGEGKREDNSFTRKSSLSISGKKKEKSYEEIRKKRSRPIPLGEGGG